MSAEQTPATKDMSAAGSVVPAASASSSSSATPDAPAPVPEGLNIRLVNQSNEEIYFRIKPTTPLRRIFEVYSQRMGIQPNNLRFLFDGARLDPEKSPADYKLEQNDTIDVAIHQTGGY